MKWWTAACIIVRRCDVGAATDCSHEARFVRQYVQLLLTKSEYSVFKANGRRGMVAKPFRITFGGAIGPRLLVFPFLAGRLGS